jgi:ATP-dependent RNA helicase RhlE
LADIEKLIKTKIELEAVEFEEDQPDIRKQGRINDGRRMYQEDGTVGGDNGRSAGRAEPRGRAHSNERDDAYRTRAPREYSRPAPAPRDPFFDKPYEPAPVTEAVVAPSWEATARPARSISANIKPKRKVAALFKSE